MSALAQLAFCYALNSLWQVPLVALLTWMVCRMVPGAAARFRLWIGAAAAGALLPLGSLGGLYVQGGSGRGVEAPDWAMRLMLTVFAAGVGWRVWVLVLGAVEARRLRRNSIPALLPVDGGPVELLEAEASADACGPLLIGVRRPVVLVPRFLREPENTELLETALAHEREHVRANDMFWIVAAEALLAASGPQPAAGWIRRQLRESCELACDGRAAAAIGRVRYARHLVEISRHLTEPAARLHVLGVTSGRFLETRVRALVETPGGVTRGWHGAAAVAAMVLACAPLLYGALSVYRAVAIPSPVEALGVDWMKRPVPPPAPPPPPWLRR